MAGRSSVPEVFGRFYLVRRLNIKITDKVKVRCLEHRMPHNLYLKGK